MIEMTVGVKKNTLSIANKFFNDIKVFIPGKNNYELQLYPRVEQFFLDMKKLGKKEFARYLMQQRYTCNINSNNREDKIRNLDVFYCLTALIISHYSRDEAFRYFFPEEFSSKVKRPTYSGSWRIIYWFQLLGYWLRQLFNAENYEPNDSASCGLIESSLKFVKNAMEDNNYLQLINAGSESLFSYHLFILTSIILKVASQDLKRTYECISADCIHRGDMFSRPERENENVSDKSLNLNLKR